MNRFPLLLLPLLLLPAGCGRSDRSTINNEGSDTMLEVAQAWREAYAKVRPEVMVSVTGGGSGRGVASLLNGTVDLANCSRKMTDKELADARKHGHDPKEHVVGYDAVGIYVHRDNPIRSITLEQLAGIYGDGGKLELWSQLGVQMPEGAGDKIIVVSRQNNSGTYECFREVALHGRNFRLGTLDLNGSKDVVDFVGKTRSAIGYCGIAYATADVKVVPVAGDKGPVAPTVDTVLDHTYAIWRPLYMYSKDEPKGPVKDYLDWILGDDGQSVLQRAGYPPLRKM